MMAHLCTREHSRRLSKLASLGGFRPDERWLRSIDPCSQKSETRCALLALLKWIIESSLLLSDDSIFVRPSCTVAIHTGSAPSGILHPTFVAFQPVECDHMFLQIINDFIVFIRTNGSAIV